MGSCPITFLWLWPATDHEPYCRHRRPKSTPQGGWRRSHMAGIYSDCSTRKIIIRTSAVLHTRHVVEDNTFKAKDRDFRPWGPRLWYNRLPASARVMSPLPIPSLCSAFYVGRQRDIACTCRRATAVQRSTDTLGLQQQTRRSGVRRMNDGTDVLCEQSW